MPAPDGRKMECRVRTIKKRPDVFFRTSGRFPINERTYGLKRPDVFSGIRNYQNVTVFIILSTNIPSIGCKLYV